MGYLEYGLSQGLAYQHNFQQDIQNLHEESMLDRQARIDAEAKAKLLSDKMQFGKTYDSYNNRRLKTFSEDKIKEIGKFVSENPNFMTSVTGNATYNQLLNDLTDNDIVNESARAKINFDEMTQFIKQHPEMTNSPRLQSQVDAYHNYAMAGSTDPESPTRQEFSFLPPVPYEDLNEKGLGYGNKVKNLQYIPLKGEGYGPGAYTQQPDPTEMDALVSDMIKNHRDQILEQYKSAGFNSPQEFAKSLIMPGIHTKTDYDTDGMIKLAIAEMRAKKGLKTDGGPTSTWEVAIKNTPAGTFPAEVSKSLFDAPGYTVIVDKYGNLQELPPADFKAGQQFITMNPRMKYQLKNNNVNKMVEGTVTMTREQAINAGLAEDTFWDQQGDVSLKSPFSGQGTIRQNDKKQWVLDLKVWKPFNDSDKGMESLYNTKVQTSKNVPETTYDMQGVKITPSKENPRYGKGDDGNYYDLTTKQIVDPNTTVE